MKKLGGIGVWASIDNLKGHEAVAFAQSIEAWGYTAYWTPEAVGRDPFVLLTFLAARTERLVLATGIANIYARDPMTTKAIHKTLSEMAPGRFVLGLGVSHEHLVKKVRGHEYEKPIPAMRSYLEALSSALYMGAPVEEDAPIVLAALRPAMLRVAREQAAGAHPYLVPPEHTAMAREVLGPDSWLCPEQMVLGERDATRARAIARANLKVYLHLPNYQRNLRAFGMEDSDFAAGGSDRLVDQIVVWGDDDAIRQRIQDHFDAGADHVCIQPFRPDRRHGPDMELLERLAPSRSRARRSI